MYIYIYIKPIDVHHILLKDQKVTTPRCPPKRLDIADRQSIGYTWAKTNSLRFSRFPTGVKKTSTGQTLSRFRWFFLLKLLRKFPAGTVTGCSLGFAALAIELHLAIMCSSPTISRLWPNPRNNQWWFSKQEEDIVSTSKTFPPLKASTIFEAAQFQNTTPPEIWCWQRLNRIFIQICSN